MLAQEIIRIKRDGGALSAAQVQGFVDGLVDGRWSEGQVAALAMAVLLRGMSRGECVALTRAMTFSGDVIDWRDTKLRGPVLDKHSTGGVGDKVSLMLAPIAAACGAVVPMVSGRGLGHTGGTLDKLACLPGYALWPIRARLVKVLRDAGCAIIGASARVAPADRRLYAIRDVTATVESVPLITASILSKKLAAGLQGLVMDVKVGNGAFCDTLPMARELATSLVEVAHGAGLPTVALLTDMNQVLGDTAGNALEMQEAIDFLTGARVEGRLFEVTLALAMRLLRLGGLAGDDGTALGAVRRALESGAAAERFERMVAGLGGPADVLRRGVLAAHAAPVKREVGAPRDGVIAAVDTRAIGVAVVALGGGRRRASDSVDQRVGFSQVRGIGASLRAGEPMALVHAASEADADAAVASYRAAVRLDDAAPAAGPVIIEAIVQTG